MDSGNCLVGHFQAYQAGTKEELKEFEDKLFSVQFTSLVKIACYCLEEGKVHFYKTQSTGKEYILLDDGEYKYI